MINLQSASVIQVNFTSTEPGTPMSFCVAAASELQALLEGLDKIGYNVEAANGVYRVVDADTHECEFVVTCHESPRSALDQIFAAVGWRASEARELVGGSLGSDYHLDTPQ